MEDDLRSELRQRWLELVGADIHLMERHSAGGAGGGQPLQSARAEVVDYEDLSTVVYQSVDEGRSNEPGPTGDNCPANHVIHQSRGRLVKLPGASGSPALPTP